MHRIPGGLSPFAIVACLALLSNPLRADDPCGCDSVLIPTREALQRDARSTLHYLNILDEQSYDQAKKDGGGSVTVPIQGVPISFSGNYSDFSEQRRSLFQEHQFDSSQSNSENVLRTSLQSDQIKHWSECKQTCNATGLSCRTKYADAETATVVVAWRPVGAVRGVVNKSSLRGATVEGTANGSLFPRGKVFEPGYSESIILDRATGKSVTLSLNVSGYPCSLTIPAPAIPCPQKHLVQEYTTGGDGRVSKSFTCPGNMIVVPGSGVCHRTSEAFGHLRKSALVGNNTWVCEWDPQPIGVGLFVEMSCDCP